MNEDRETEARASEEDKLAAGKSGDRIAEETSPETPGALSVGREGEIEAGPATQSAPGILDSGTF